MTDLGDSLGYWTIAERRIRNRILTLPRLAKQLLMLAADTLGVLFCVWVAVWLLSPIDLTAIVATRLTAPTLAITVLFGAQQGFYHSIIRYVGMDLAYAAVKVALVSGAVLGAVAWWDQPTITPVRLALVYGALSLLYLVGSRYVARFYLNRRNSGRERVIVYGAGEAGARLVLSMQDGDSFLPVALIDDKKSLQGKRVAGLPVHSMLGIEALVQELEVTRVLLALPSASRRRRQAIIASLVSLSIRVQTIPDLHDLVTGKSRVDDIREVDVVDLLGRDAVPPNANLLKASVLGKNVMVTGAGGSIGSELCRQVLALKPATLVLFEISEIALYTIEKELSKLAESNELDVEIIALLGSVNHQSRVFEIMNTFSVNTVYHTAAYKHVPVVEQNIIEGIRNNIFGTLHTAQAAVDAKVETFVLISTDKAVSPTNAMGATKRFAELILQAMQDDHKNIRFCMVRFGNVLESSGSVVPLFREQIRSGGPVTVTHRDIIRYFMTIPEAAQLVIQAGAMARGGDVFVLDMGKPVKIQDLARRMIHLMGFEVRDDSNPDGDIEIKYTGLRPAEKLYEELLIGGDVSGTNHPRIMRANEEYVERDLLEPAIEALRECTARLDCDQGRQVLLNAVSGYRPTNGIDDLVWAKTHERSASDKANNIVTMPKRSA